MTLQPGASGEVVTVEATAALTDTETSSQGSVIDNKEVVGLPLNQRTFYGLALLSPAAYLPGQSSTLGFRGGFNVAGNNETANTFTVNGIDDNDQNVMAPSFRPSVEAIQEFKLLTGVYSAEYGRTSGGQVVVVTKRGTNASYMATSSNSCATRNSTRRTTSLCQASPPPSAVTSSAARSAARSSRTRPSSSSATKAFAWLSPSSPIPSFPTRPFLNGDFSSVCTSGFTAGVCNTASQQLHNPVTLANYANNQIPVHWIV